MGRVKSNSNAWETTLSDEQRDQAFDLAKTLGYEKARHLIAREFKIKAPSIAGMCRFYERMARIYNERSIEKALVDVGNLNHLADKLPGLTKAKRAALEKAYLDALLTGDPDRIKLFGELILKHQAQDNDTERLRLQVDKYRDAIKATQDALAGAKSKGGVTPETIAKIEESLKLL